MERLKGDTVPGLICIEVGLAFLLPSINLGIIATTKDGVPGAGFFPAILSSGVILGGIGLFFNGFMAKGSFEYFHLDEEQKKNIRPFFITIISMLVFMLLWKFVDFFVAMALFCLFLNRIYKRSWKFNILFTVGLVVGIYIAFTVLLKIQFDL